MTRREKKAKGGGVWMELIYYRFGESQDGIRHAEFSCWGSIMPPQYIRRRSAGVFMSREHGLIIADRSHIPCSMCLGFMSLG